MPPGGEPVTRLIRLALTRLDYILYYTRLYDTSRKADPEEIFTRPGLALDDMALRPKG